jgi:hypothetical protein
MTEPIFAVLGLIGLLAVGMAVQQARPSHKLRIGLCWLRWVCFSVCFALLMQHTGWLSNPLWVLICVGALLWCLLDTLYIWMLVNFLSKSEVPLFPRYRVATQAHSWPADRASIRLRDWLRARGFVKRATLTSDLTPEVALHLVVFDHPSEHLRIQVLFFPRGKQRWQMAFVVTSQMPNQECVLTDNVPMPFGSSYPPSWFVSRCPLVGCIERLIKRHQARLRTYGVEPVPLEPAEDVCGELNRLQQELEAHNRRTGFLSAEATEAGEDRLSTQGRYQLWKAFFLMNYFGIAAEA